MKTIAIRTEIPGPRSRALMARRETAIPRGPSNATPIFAASAEGATITDVDGNRYLDFAGGIGVLNAGHRAPRVTAAIREQLEKHLHLCFAVTPYEGYVAVAEKLNDKHLDALRAALKQVSGKDVDLELKIDPAIIGGLVVKLGSRMVDTSLRTKLNAIKHVMKEVR